MLLATEAGSIATHRPASRAIHLPVVSRLATPTATTAVAALKVMFTIATAIGASPKMAYKPAMSNGMSGGRAAK